MLHHPSGNAGRQRRFAILDAAQLRAQFDLGPILEQITERSGLQRREEMVVVVKDGDHDRACLGTNFRQRANQLKPAGVGQAEVDQKEIDRLALQDLHGVTHAARLKNAHAGIVFPQQFDKPGAHSREVVHNQRALHGTHMHPFLFIGPHRQWQRQTDTINTDP